MRNKQTQSYPPKNVGFGFYLFILAIGAFLSSCGTNIPNSETILAAVPEEYKDNPGEYILNSVQFASQLQNQLNNATNTSIPEELQHLISENMNEKCPDDTIRGVNFKLSSLMATLLRAQSNMSIFDMLSKDYGIYVAFGKYPSTKPVEFTTFGISDSDYILNYAGRRTAYINYTITNNGSTTFLKDANNQLVGDNFGTPCPRICPPY